MHFHSSYKPQERKEEIDQVCARMKLDFCREQERSLKRPASEGRQRASHSNTFKPSKKKGPADKEPKENIDERAMLIMKELEEMNQPAIAYGDT